MSNSFDPKKFDGKPSDYEQNIYESSRQNFTEQGFDLKKEENQNQSQKYYNEYVTRESGDIFEPPLELDPKYKKKRLKKEKKSSGKSKTALLIVACMIISTVFGIGGSYAGNVLFAVDDDTTGSTIIQEVVNSSDSATGDTDISDVVDATADTVVEISTEIVETSTYMEQYVSEGAGSGVIISSDGYIITNHHVIDGASKITVTMTNGDQHEAELIGSDEESDIAVIKIEATNLDAAVIGSSADLKVGDTVIAIGNPLGQLGGTVTEGIISALDREVTVDGEVMTLLQTSAAVNPGNSGGGLFNDKGELIGIVNSKTSASGIEGLGFAIPIDTAKDIAVDLMDYGYVTGQVRMGVSFIEILDNQTANQYRVDELGIYLYQIYEGTDAQTAGLQSGDMIISINGTLIISSSQVQEMIEDSEVGDVLNIIVKRNGSEQEIELLFTEYQP